MSVGLGNSMKSIDKGGDAGERLGEGMEKND